MEIESWEKKLFSSLAASFAHHTREITANMNCECWSAHAKHANYNRCYQFENWEEKENENK